MPFDHWAILSNLSMTTKEAMFSSKQPSLFGHPTSLFTLFFTEMWERFSYYGMRALLVFYMIKGFMRFSDGRAYSVYGAYTALVYATPFIGGVLADRILGSRRAVLLGGVLMAAGHLLMTIQTELAFFGALSLLILGNGFFKPNMQTIVGSLYTANSKTRDGGFTIFYMGINLGAAISPLICGYVGENYGWHYGFGLATVGMLVGLAVFVAKIKVAQFLILGCALTTSLAMLFLQNNAYQLIINIFVGTALLAAAAIAFVALGRSKAKMQSKVTNKSIVNSAQNRAGFFRAERLVYLSIPLSIPVIMLMLYNSSIAGYLLSVFGLLAIAWLSVEAFRATKNERRRLLAIFVLMFFSMLFWSFFEQAGSSINNFTDRNVDRVFEANVVTVKDIGKTTKLKITQEQIGYSNKNNVIHLNNLNEAQELKQDEVDWTFTEEHLGMKIGGAEIPASLFQAANPIFVLVFGILFTGLWSFLGRKNLEPSTPVKFALGLFQLGLGFAALYWGATNSDSRGMISMSWLLLGYLFHTTGELCISPVGLSMVSRLSPVRIVSTVMGAWMLAMAFSNYLASIIAGLTGVLHYQYKGTKIPLPIDTVNLYGEIFGKIALTAILSGFLCLALSPLLVRWMKYEDIDNE